jgi:general secretion pathway protein L
VRAIGIDVGSFSVKVSVVDSTKKGLNLERFSEHIFMTTNPFDRNLEVIEFLRKELGGEDKLQTRFVCSVPQDLVSIHTKIFPFKDRLKIFRSLPFELEEDTPFNPEDTIFDGRIVRFESAQAEVLACACPKDTVKKYLQLMLDSGITPNLLTPEGIGFANHFERWVEPIPTVAVINDPSLPSDLPIPPRSCQAVLNIGHTKTLLLILENTKLVDIRSISWGGENIAKVIQDKYSITYPEAIKQLQGNSFILTNTEGATPDQIYFSGIIAGVVNEVVRELRLVLMEIQATTNVEIGSISMTGGVSRLPNLGPYLTQGLELPVNKISLLNNYPNTLFEKSAWNDAVSGTAIGLAIEGLRKPRNPFVSLLRGDFAVQSHAIKNFVEAWGTSLRFAAIAIVVLYVYANFRESMALSMVEKADVVMKDQAQALAHLKGSKASEAGIEKFISQKRKMVREVRELESILGMNSALEILRKVNDAAPGRSTVRMEVRQFSVKDTNVHIEGYVNTAKDSDMLQQSLRNLAKDLKIRSTPTQIAVPAGKIGFGFDFAVDRNVKLSKAPIKPGSSNE